MGVTEINSHDEFKRIISAGKPVLIEFGAVWCGPCKAISPIFEKHSNELQNIGFYKVDTEDQPEIVQEVAIRSIPCFIVFKDGEKVDSLSGANPPALKKLADEANAMA